MLDLTKESRDPATKLASAQVLNTGPLGVPTLAAAAKLLRVELAEVERAAEHVTPWLHFDERTTLWSVRQLARNVMMNRNRSRLKPAPKTTSKGPALSREDTEAAALLAETATRAQVAAAAGITPYQLQYCFKQYGIKVQRGSTMEVAA